MAHSELDLTDRRRIEDMRLGQAPRDRAQPVCRCRASVSHRLLGRGVHIAAS